MKDELTPWDHYAIAALREFISLYGAPNMIKATNYLELVPAKSAQLANRMMQLRKVYSNENPSK